MIESRWNTAYRANTTGRSFNLQYNTGAKVAAKCHHPFRLCSSSCCLHVLDTKRNHYSDLDFVVRSSSFRTITAHRINGDHIQFLFSSPVILMSCCRWHSEMPGDLSLRPKIFRRTRAVHFTGIQISNWPRCFLGVRVRRSETHRETSESIKTHRE